MIVGGTGRMDDYLLEAEVGVDRVERLVNFQDLVEVTHGRRIPGVVSGFGWGGGWPGRENDG